MGSGGSDVGGQRGTAGPRTSPPDLARTSRLWMCMADHKGTVWGVWMRGSGGLVPPGSVLSEARWWRAVPTTHCQAPHQRPLACRTPTKSIARASDCTVFWEACLGKFVSRGLSTSTAQHCKGERAARATNAAPRPLGRVRGPSVAARGTTTAVRDACNQRRRSSRFHCLGRGASTGGEDRLVD